MQQKLTILGRLDDLNKYTDACRSNQYKGAKMKSDNEKIVIYYARRDKLKPVKKYPVEIKIYWYEKDKRRDYDNVVSAKKFLFDGLIKAKILKDDGRTCIDGHVEEYVLVDKNNPRIEVILTEKE